LSKVDCITSVTAEEVKTSVGDTAKVEPSVHLGELNSGGKNISGFLKHRFKV